MFDKNNLINKERMSKIIDRVEKNVKLFSLSVFFVFSYGLVSAQTLSSTKNFIAETNVKVSGKTNLSQLEGLPKNEVNTNVKYIDGFGRPLQTISIQASPLGNDFVQPFVFDDLGREKFSYLPYASQNNPGQFKENAIANGVYTFYNPGAGLPLSDGVTRIANPYHENIFEASPLNRVIEQGAPGNNWIISNGHTLKSDYTFNNNGTNFTVDGLACRKYTSVSVTTQGLEHKRTLNTSGFYNANELYITIKKDENWTASDGKAGTVEEYKDKNGAVVLKRTFNKKPDNTLEALSTYYVYDDFGLLSFVLPPGANPDNGGLTQEILDNYCYQYYYDFRNRLIEKKIPGRGWEFAVYNNLDQLVFSQDANQRAKSQKEWNFVKYDAFGRTIITGLVQDNRSRAELQDELNNLALSNQPLWEQRDNGNSNGTYTGYSNVVFPISNIISYYTISYYDDYSFYGNNFGPPVNGQASGNRVKSLPVASKINVIGPSGAQKTAQNMLLQVNYYDNEGRIVQSKTQNHLGGDDVVDNNYNFAGELLGSIRTHKGSSTSLITTVASEYLYDHTGRKTKTFQQINTNSNVGPKILVAENIYNEAGQLKEKKLHTTGQPSATDIVVSDIVQSGQTKVITAGNSIVLSPGFEAKEGSVFSASISDGKSLATVKYVYNERGWLKKSTSDLFSFQLNYDEATGTATPQYNGNVANQLWAYGNDPGLNTFSYAYDKLNRLVQASSPNLGEAIVYDGMGNIQSLYREGKGTNNYIAYTGHQLTQVQGFTNAVYSYDQNGNLIGDSQKNIAITYNSLGFPAQISGSQSIVYLYDALGNKLQKQSASGVTDYVSGIQYKNNGASIDIILTEEGFARNQGSGNYSYEYNLSDQLGNNRLTFHQNPNTQQLEVLQKDDYYAFGYRKPVQLSSTDNKYLYNGKEIQDELEEYDYGARFYNPVLARWSAIDPMAEKMRSFSPYNYALNNPISLNDPDGMMPVPVGGIPGMTISVPTSKAEAASMIASLYSMQIQLFKDITMMTTMKSTMDNLQEYALNELNYGMHRGRGYEAMLRSGQDPGLIDLEYKLNKAIATAKLVGNAIEWLAFGAGGGEMMLAAAAIKAPAMQIVKEGVKELSEEFVKTSEKEIIKIAEDRVPIGRLASIEKSATENGAKLSTNGVKLNEHLRQLEKYGQAGFNELQNGRFRYYGNVTPANNPGEMIGRRVVREWNPANGGTRTWMETLDGAGTIRIVRPETGGVKVHYMFNQLGNYTGRW